MKMELTYSIIHQNKLLNEFFYCEKNQFLLAEYQKNKSEKAKYQLDQRFKVFYLRIKAVSYMSKLIHFEAIHYDQKVKNREEKISLILDSEIEEGVKHIDLLESKHVEMLPLNKLEDYIEEQNLHDTVKKLPEKQKNILFLLFVKNQKEKEVSSLLGITQQAVSKHKKAALLNIKKGLKINEQ